VARKPSLDRSVVELAVKNLGTAKTADELRQAQAVAFPDGYGIDLQRTAEMIGKSRTSVARLRNEFVAGAKGEKPLRSTWGGRRRENISREEEEALLLPFFETAKKGGILVVAPVKKAYERTVGHKVPESTIYRLLARHDWRKLAPDKRHPKTDPLAQEEFKKNSTTSSGRKKS